LRPSPVSPQGGLAQRNPSSSPAGRDQETGLPIGVLITGRRLREDLCLEAAEAIEARLGLATPIDPVR
jgi:amidase